MNSLILPYPYSSNSPKLGSKTCKPLKMLNVSLMTAIPMA